MAYVSPLVGRDSEHIMLAEALRRCRSGRGGVVLISGEAGIGKTRLVDEVFGEWDGSCRRGRPPRISSRTSDQRLPHGQEPRGKANREPMRHNYPPRAQCVVQLWSITAFPGQPFPCT